MTTTLEHHLADIVEKTVGGLWKIRCSCGEAVRGVDCIAAHQAHDLHVVDVGVAEERGE